MTPPPAEHLAARVLLGPALRAQPDRRLVEMVRRGYDAAFEEIVRRYRRPLDRFAAAIVGPCSEDVTQDAFSKALLALRGSEAEIELRPWLYRIVRNTALNDLRDRAPATAELSEALPGGRSAAAEAEAREELRDLMGRLRALPEPQRAALVMRELEGLSHEEIAAALGVSGGAARQAIYRARAALRDGLGLLVPMPVLQALAGHGDDAARTGGALAAGGASSAGGAALGGLGGGALKVGMATVLVAGAVGAGVAVEHRQGDGPGPEAAEAAPLVKGPRADRQGAAGEGGGTSRSGRDEDRGGDESGQRGEDRSGDGGGGSLGEGDRSGPHHSGRSGSGSGSNSGPGDDSGSGSRHSGPDGSGDDNSGPGSVSDDGLDGSSGSSGPDDGSGGSSGESSGPGSGEIESEPLPAPEAEIEDGGSSGSGSDDLSSLETSGSDVSP
jgi:RNA polymerase sigma factor (sigma-70 family)